MLYNRTIRSNIKAPRSLQITLLLPGYALVLKKMFGPRSNEHFDPEDVALRQIFIQAPGKRSIAQMHEPHLSHQTHKALPINGVDVKIKGDCHRAVVRL